MNLTQRGVGKALEPISESLKVFKTQIAKTGQIEEVASAFNMPVNLAHVLDLDAIRDDGDRAKQLDANIRTLAFAGQLR
mgnify:CR=1 FL=1